MIFLEYVLSARPIRRFIQKMITPYTRFMFGVDFTHPTTAPAVTEPATAQSTTKARSE